MTGSGFNIDYTIWYDRDNVAHSLHDMSYEELQAAKTTCLNNMEYRGNEGDWEATKALKAEEKGHFWDMMTHDLLRAYQGHWAVLYQNFAREITLEIARRDAWKGATITAAFTHATLPLTNTVRCIAKAGTVQGLLEALADPQWRLEVAVVEFPALQNSKTFSSTESFQEALADAYFDDGV